MTERGQKPFRDPDTVEVWDRRGSPYIVDWRRVSLCAESQMRLRWRLHHTVEEVNRRRPTHTPRCVPRELRWLPISDPDTLAAGWMWDLVIDDSLCLPVRPMSPWVESTGAPQRESRVGPWWHVCCPADHRWSWYVGAATLEGAVLRALHGDASIATTVRVDYWEVMPGDCRLLDTIVTAQPPGRAPIHLQVVELGGPRDPRILRWGGLHPNTHDATPPVPPAPQLPGLTDEDLPPKSEHDS